jgi:hypothetical protein
MNAYELIEFASKICGPLMWEEIIPYLEFEQTANRNIAMDPVYKEAIQICKDKLSIYESEVNE